MDKNIFRVFEIDRYAVVTTKKKPETINASGNLTISDISIAIKLKYHTMIRFLILWLLNLILMGLNIDASTSIRGSK